MCVLHCTSLQLEAWTNLPLVRGAFPPAFPLAILYTLAQESLPVFHRLPFSGLP